MDSVELALNEPGDDGVSALLSQFYDAWQEVANHPEDTPTKSALVVNAQALVDGVKALDSNLAAIQGNAANQFAAYTSANGEVLSDAAAIAKLNQQIKDATAAGQQPNALLDQRDQLIDKLAELGQVTITELPYGSIQVAFGNVNPPLLVDDTTAWTPTSPATTLYATPSPGGKLGALQDISKTGGIIDQYRTDLNTFVNQLVDQRQRRPRRRVLRHHGHDGGDDGRRPGIAANPATIRTTNVAGAPAGANDVALAVAGLRGRHRRPHLRRLRPARRHREPRRHAPRHRRRRGPAVGLRPTHLDLRGLDRRGDGQHDPLPAQLPGLVANDVDDGRHARHPHQPHGKGRALMRITQSMMTDRLLSNLSRSQERLARASEEMQTQKKLLKPSDDPVGAQLAVMTRGELAANDKHSNNISQARGFMQTAGSSLDGITSLLHRAQELTIQGANGATGDEARKNIAAEIDQIIDAVKQAGNTNYAGVFIFSGTATTTQPYDTTTIPAVDAYQGDNGMVAREIGPGVSVQINTLVNSGTPPLLGSGGGDGGLIDTLRNISTHLKSGAARRRRRAGHDRHRGARRQPDAINKAQAVLGATVNRLDAADDRLSSTKIASTQLLSDTEDVDAATAYLNLSTTQSVYEAALKAGATIIQPSLLDFLSMKVERLITTQEAACL